MRYRFFTCDVFTDTRFGGNQLAVLPEAAGLSDEQMQRIAREFNYSETTFVLPAEAGHTRRVRIFTPPREVPFAGHPNIGTAFVLAGMGAFGSLDEPLSVTFEEQAGLVPVAVHKRREGRIWCELTAPQRLTLGTSISAESVAAAVSLAADDILTTAHAPLVASVGLPFILAELRDREALGRARPDLSRLEGLAAEGIDQPDILLYVRTSDGFDLHARVFAPVDGVPEDPPPAAPSVRSSDCSATTTSGTRRPAPGACSGRRDGPPQRAGSPHRERWRRRGRARRRRMRAGQRGAHRGGVRRRTRHRARGPVSFRSADRMTAMQESTVCRGLLSPGLSRTS